VGHPGRGGAHGAPGRQPEERPREMRAAKRSPQRREREQGDAEAGPMEEGKGRHGFLASLPSCIRRE
jgi:hypothetical protein